MHQTTNIAGHFQSQPGSNAGFLLEPVITFLRSASEKFVKFPQVLNADTAHAKHPRGALDNDCTGRHWNLFIAANPYHLLTTFTQNYGNGNHGSRFF